MLDKILASPSLPFTVKTPKAAIPLYIVSPGGLPKLKKTLGAQAAAQIDARAYDGRPGSGFVVIENNGKITSAIVGIGNDTLYDAAAGYAALAQLSASQSFQIVSEGLHNDRMNAFCLGWALAGHRFDMLKSEKSASPMQLVWPKQADRARVTALFEGIVFVRNLINTPANILGPVELEQAARTVAGRHGVKIKVVSGEKLEKDFPLIHAVGVSSPRAPRLIDFTWGDPNHPKITLVGKGVCFDTGGLDLKPGPFMLQMKKDMGGSAHVLGLAHIIMALGVKIRLRVLIPAVENAVSGRAFRPRDVYRSRKGLSVETGDTDAEGRLILADALALACEEKPALIIDCATLTGSARAGLGYDIPAILSNRDALAEELKQAGIRENDPVWPLPLWQGYRKELASDIADLNNIGSSPAGAITAALFLDHFVEPQIPWLHIDMFAWEQNGKPGRPRGGADTGLRALLSFIEQRSTVTSAPAPRPR